MHIYHLGIDVYTLHTYDACLMAHFALDVKFTTSDLCAINLCRVSKGISFISDICNHQGT